MENYKNTIFEIFKENNWNYDQKQLFIMRIGFSVFESMIKTLAYNWQVPVDATRKKIIQEFSNQKSNDFLQDELYLEKDKLN